MNNRCCDCNKPLLVPTWKTCNECDKHKKKKRTRNTLVHFKNVDIERNFFDDNAREFTRKVLKSFPQVGK